MRRLFTLRRIGPSVSVLGGSIYETCFSRSESTSLRCSSSLGDQNGESPARAKYHTARVVPLTSQDIRSAPRLSNGLIASINARSFVNTLLAEHFSSRAGSNLASIDEGDDGADEEVMYEAFSHLVPALSSFVFEVGVPLAFEQLIELFVPVMVFVEDFLLARSSKGSVLMLDDINSENVSSDSPGYLFHQATTLPECKEESDGLVREWFSSGDFAAVPAALAAKVHVVNNDSFDKYFDVMMRALSGTAVANGLFIHTCSANRLYVMPGTTEYFLRRLYPCIRKDSFKALWHVCLSAGWTGFGRTRMSDVETLEAYFQHVLKIMGEDSPIECVKSELTNGAGDGSFLLRRRQEDYILPSVNELSRFTRVPILPPSPPPPPPPQPKASAGGDSANPPSDVIIKPFSLPLSSPLYRLHTEVVLPQAHRMQTRGLSTLLAYLQSERQLLQSFDEKDPFGLIALATRLSTPTFILEVLVKCPAKRSKDPQNHPLPAWCFPLFAGYFVAGDDLVGIADMHIRSGVKTVLSYDKSDNDLDSLRNASSDLKRMLYHHHDHISAMHAHVLLCSFRFMQKHEQLHRALKKSIVAADDKQVKASRIKEITGNVLNSLTELEYCINANLRHIPTVPLAPGRKKLDEDPEEIKLAKANALFQYWYLDWLAAHC